MHRSLGSEFHVALEENGLNMQFNYLLRRTLLMVSLAFAIASCATSEKDHRIMESTITENDVVQFLHGFEALAEKEDFNLIRDKIHERAYFRFNDGDFRGRDAIQAVFEKTWRGDPSVKKARFYLSDIVVVTMDQKTATATYTYNWEGSQGDKQFRIQGRGTRVLTRASGQWQIVHEHLSRFPPLK
jgi:ketosteroid isomerase-like protein